MNALERVWPDLTIILDVDLEASSRRLNRDLDRMEQKGDGYHQKVRRGFLKLADEKKNFFIVDGTGEINAVNKKIIEVVEKLF
jgi:dTMP kinase